MALQVLSEQLKSSGGLLANFSTLDWPPVSLSLASWHTELPLSPPRPHPIKRRYRGVKWVLCLKFTPSSWLQYASEKLEHKTIHFLTVIMTNGVIVLIWFPLALLWHDHTIMSNSGMQIPWYACIHQPTQACILYSNWGTAYFSMNEELPLGSYRQQLNEIKDSAHCLSHYLQHALISRA